MSHWIQDQRLAGSSAIGLDFGDWTPMTEKIEQIFGIKFYNTDFNFDDPSESCKFVDRQQREVPRISEGSIPVICSFEVLEHLFNPLLHLRVCYRYLRPDGRLFLSTPMGRPNFLVYDQHFHEMPRKKLLSLVEAAGSGVIRYERKFAPSCPIWHWLYGVRPILRYLDERTVFMELERSSRL